MINTSRGINWVPTLFLTTYQALFLISLPYYIYSSPPSLILTFTSIVLLYITGISITGGYHRYFSHRAFKTNSFVEGVILFLGSMTAQGSALRWSYDHRIHHAFVDTDNDPYSIKKGFLYAHCLWILEKPREIEQKVVSDLMRNKLIMFQHNYYGTTMVVTNLIVFVLFGWLFDNYLGSLMMIVGLRMFLLHHFTWFINSLAHTWGDKPFCTEQTAVDNYFISLLTFGEGYHNYHHTYANDYRNGIKWYHFDPTKWTIWSLNKLGLARDLKRMDSFTIKKRMVVEREELLMSQIKDLWYVKKDELESMVLELSNRIQTEINDFKKLRDRYQKTKRESKSREVLLQMKTEMKDLKVRLKKDWKQWKQLSSNIQQLRPI